MITNVSTAEIPAVSPLSKLQPRPATRAEARALILAMAKGAAALSADQDDAVEQCARIVGVCLWHDVDDALFGSIVDDLIAAENITSGGVADLGEDDTAETRGSWINYYETQVAWKLDMLLAETGYRR